MPSGGSIGRLVVFGAMACAAMLAAAGLRAGEVEWSLHEGKAEADVWQLLDATPTVEWREPAFASAELPRKYGPRAAILDWSNPLVAQAAATIELPAGKYELLVRAKGGARLTIDDQLVLEQSKMLEGNADGHERMPKLPEPIRPGLRPLPPGHKEKLATIELAAGEHRVRLETVLGGKGLRVELGEPCVAIAKTGGPFVLLTPAHADGDTLDDPHWADYARGSRARVAAANAASRRTAASEWIAYWQTRHKIARREVSKARAGDANQSIDRVLDEQIAAHGLEAAPAIDDDAFLRRVMLDTVGVIPTPAETARFRADPPGERRAKAIDRLLADPRWADHWTSFWQDLLAENPNVLKPTLNNTGPFRTWIHESLLDNKGLDQFVTELILMEGSAHGGGAAGFGVASQNDAPMAEKAHVLAQALLGVDMKCARCHDAPYQPYKQRELFQMAAMLERKTLTLPGTSVVPIQPGGRVPAVPITLKPGDKIAPDWPLVSIAKAELPAGLLPSDADERMRLAAIVTSPRNARFAEVVANRLWQRSFGRGLVEGLDNWTFGRDGAAESPHSELVKWLGRELAAHDYDLKHVARLILNSRAYQRKILPDSSPGEDEARKLFATPTRRRLSAEQLVDSLFVAAGKEFHAEMLTFDPEGRRPLGEFINLGTPRRAWQFASLSNERDRPALALPVTQSVVDVLKAFGWRESRAAPASSRDHEANLLQPLELANGLVGRRIASLSDDSALVELALAEGAIDELVEKLYRRIVTRAPSEKERAIVGELLAPGFAERRTGEKPTAENPRAWQRHAVSWSNHLSPEATETMLRLEKAAQAGDPPTRRLTREWRERLEDVVWALVNSPEFVFVP